MSSTKTILILSIFLLLVSGNFVRAQLLDSVKTNANSPTTTRSATVMSATTPTIETDTNEALVDAQTVLRIYHENVKSVLTEMNLDADTILQAVYERANEEIENDSDASKVPVLVWLLGCIKIPEGLCHSDDRERCFCASENDCESVPMKTVCTQCGGKCGVGYGTDSCPGTIDRDEMEDASGR